MEINLIFEFYFVLKIQARPEEAAITYAVFWNINPEVTITKFKWGAGCIWTEGLSGINNWQRKLK
jgi:hypothetical protein